MGYSGAALGIMEYTIKQGHWMGTKLEIGRVPRQYIDEFITEHPEPDPPPKKASELGVEIWGDPDEMVPDHNDADYLTAHEQWTHNFGLEMMELVAGAIKIPGETEAAALLELEEMRALKLMEGDGALPSLLHLVGAEDLAEIVALIFYLSTVSIRGLAEAAKSYDIHWNKKKVPVVSRSTGPASASNLYESRLAALWSGYRWPEFSDLPGAEQSAIVALYRYKHKLEELSTKGTK